MTRRADARYRYVILAVGTGAQASFAAAGFGVAVLAPELALRYHLGLSTLGVVIATTSLGQVLTLLPWGIVTDRTGERLVTGLGLGACAACVGSAAFAGSAATLIVLLLLAGVTGAGINSATGRAVMGWFTAEERGVALGIRQTAIPIGAGFSALVLPAIGDLRTSFLVLGGVVAVAAAVGAVALLEPPVEPEPLDAEAIIRPLRDRRLWRISVTGSFLVVVQFSVLGFVVLFLHGARGFSTGEAGAVLAGIQVIGGVLRVASGRWSDRVRSRLRPIRILALLLTVAMALVAALVHAPTWALVPALLVAGGLSMGWNALAFTAAAELAGRARAGAALGLQQTALAIASGVTPLVFAPIVEATSWRTGFALVALCPLVAIYVLRGLGR